MLLAAVLAACAGTPPGPAVSVPVSRGVVEKPVGEPYAGLGFSAHDGGGVRVDGVWPGPAALAGLAPGDRILAIDGAAATPGSFAARVARARPGDALALDVRRAGTPLALRLVLGDRDDWTAPAMLPAALARSSVAHPPTPHLDAALREVRALSPDIARRDAALDVAFESLAARGGGHHTLPIVRAALGGVAALDREARGALAAAGRAPDEPGSLAALLCGLLAVRCPAAAAAPAGDPDALVAALAAAHAEVLAAFAAPASPRAALLADAAWIIEQTAAGHAVHAQPETRRALRAMQASTQFPFERLLAGLAHLLPFAAAGPAPSLPGARERPALPAGLVEGEVRSALEVAGGYVVVGGAGANRYDMDRLVAVIDGGGDDVYVWRAAVPPPVQVVIDAAGADSYEASYGGPGAGWGGVSLLVDRAGNDRYRSVFGGCGAGVFGFGVLLDEQGDDVYRCDAWSAGAGLYGGGVLIDGGGADAYLSQILSQGAGGPRGAGMLIDRTGADLYRANGLVGSAYGTPAVFQGFSQGVGFGIRPLDTGGVGLLLDGAGDDRYEAGEFSQGGGYFWALGLLHDAAGDDLYYGNRYAQGFGAHQAAGRLYDAAGDDAYWSMTAAAQGAAWDESLAVLEDAAGNDVYRAGGLSQGAAAHQSRAWLIDGGGDDAYRASAAIVQGASGEDHYHYDARAPVLSLGVLLDGAGHDHYTRGVPDGEVRIDGAVDGRGAGVLLDRP